MFRFLFRVVAVVLVLSAAAYFWASGREGAAGLGERAEGAASRGGQVARERAREAGAQIAQTISVGAERAEAALVDARLTAKIKSKMALDDTVAASRLDVDTSGGVVTVRGVVDTPAQRERALQLARETDGVRSLEDRIEVVGHP
jgi:hyperosmotically inducible protein